VVGSVVTSSLHGPLRTGLAPASHTGWWVIAGCGVAVLVVGLVTSGRWARGTAEATAQRLMGGEAPVPAGSR
jgi:hypothetical protein